MCTVNDFNPDEAASFMDVKPRRNLHGALCKKCNEKKGEVVLRVRDAYCRDCFLASARHKFRAVLGKSRLMKAQDKVLVAVSGSQFSFALLHLTQSGVNDTSHKQLRCTPFAFYIDEGAVLGLAPEERQKICHDMAVLLESYKIPAFVSSLDKSLSCNETGEHLYATLDSNTVLDINEKRDGDIKSFISQVRSLTSKDDLVQKLRNRLFLKVAEQLKCSKIFVGETGTHLAIKLMSNLSLGRGAQLPFDIGFCDSRCMNIQVLRPLRDFMNKEVAFYNTFHNIKSLAPTSLGTKVDSHSSIQKLTEKFITELQDEFPSTVYNVFRTGEKLHSNEDAVSTEDYCVLCQAPLDTSCKTSISALQATEFSRLLSNAGPANYANGQRQMPQISNCAIIHSTYEGNSFEDNKGSDCICGKWVNSRSQEVSLHEAEMSLCYGCRLIVREMGSLSHLPNEIASAVKRKIRMKEMKREIQDFLL